MHNPNCHNVVVHFRDHYYLLFDEEVSLKEAEAALEGWCPDSRTYEEEWEETLPKDRPVSAYVIN